MWINLFVFQSPDGNRLALEIGLECVSPEKMKFTISNPLGLFNCLAVLYFPFGLSPYNWALTM